MNEKYDLTINDEWIVANRGKSFYQNMNEKYDLTINDEWIVANRGKKNAVDPQKPYAWLVEKEYTISGKIEETAIIFLTNRECPFHCLMCDLWKNTTKKSLPIGETFEVIQ
jgi:hypothetical protein